MFSGLQQKMPSMNMNGVNIILYLYFHQIEIFQMMKNVFALQTGICLIRRTISAVLFVHSTIISVPAPISTQPMADFSVNDS